MLILVESEEKERPDAWVQRQNRERTLYVRHPHVKILEESFRNLPISRSEPCFYCLRSSSCGRWCLHVIGESATCRGRIAQGGKVEVSRRLKGYKSQTSAHARVFMNTLCSRVCTLAAGTRVLTHVFSQGVAVCTL